MAFSNESSGSPADEVQTAPSNTLIDPVTGLPDGRYFQIAVKQGINRGKRHFWPTCVVLVRAGVDVETSFASSDEQAARLVKVMRMTFREADTICRVDAITYGLILEDTAAEGAGWAIDRLTLNVARNWSETKLLESRSLHVGIAAYPEHVLESKEVLGYAQAALDKAPRVSS